MVGSWWVAAVVLSATHGLLSQHTYLHPGHLKRTRMLRVRWMRRRMMMHRGGGWSHLNLVIQKPVTQNALIIREDGHRTSGLDSTISRSSSSGWEGFSSMELSLSLILPSTTIPLARSAYRTTTEPVSFMILLSLCSSGALMPSPQHATNRKLATTH